MNLITLAGLLTSAVAVMAGLSPARRQSVPSSCERFARAAGQVYELETEAMPEPSRCFGQFVANYFFGIEGRDSVEKLACLFAENQGDPENLFRALDGAGYIDNALRFFYDTMAASLLGDVPRSFRNDPTSQLHNKCFGPSEPDMKPSFVREEDIINMFRTIDELGILDFDREGTRLMNGIVSTETKAIYLSDTCSTSDITDKATRCRMLKGAFTKVWDQLLAVPGSMMRIRFALGYVQTFTGIDLNSDVHTAAPNLACKLGEVRNLSELRELAEELNVKSTLLPLGYNAIHLKMSQGHTEAQKVLSDPHNHTEAQLALARAKVELWMAIKELDQGPPPINEAGHSG